MKIPRLYQQETIDNIKRLLKQSTDPILVDASVGSGKSLICAEILLWIEKGGYKALCVTMNSTLISQNHQTYLEQGGNAGLYCAGLAEKNTTEPIIFGSPHSIVQGIKDGAPIAKVKFNLIMVDECHSIDYHNKDSMLMKLLNWYGYQAQLNSYNFRIIGLSGTCYRGKGLSIVGENELFKTKACEISTSWLIDNGYLTKPYFGHNHIDGIDFSNCHVDSFGKFRHKDIELALSKNERLTAEIMREVTAVVENGRIGAFIFASTKRHCEECLAALPEGQAAIITGDTTHEVRKRTLQYARNGDIKYLINVSCLVVGVDVPSFDVCAWLRPTESLVLYTQGIGRVLRLHEGKSSALILDYAGNLDRHGDIDDPIINKALQPEADNEKDFCIPCYTCGSLNTIHARRCIGLPNNKRCDHYFEFKDCPICELPNDITSRACRGCQHELIDPNAKLARTKAETFTFDVIEARYTVTPQGYTSFPVINVIYLCAGVNVYESYFTNTEKSKNIFYAKFVRLHMHNASDCYKQLSNLHFMKTMIEQTFIKTPQQIICTKNAQGFYRVMKKIFNDA